MKLDSSKLLETLAASPPIRAALSDAADRLVAERQAHLDAIARLDAEATKAWASQERRKSEALAARDAAKAAYLAAEQSAARVFNAVSNERFANEGARRRHEVALLEPDFPEIEAFTNWLYDERERVCKSGRFIESVNVNRLTGKRIVTVRTNKASVLARLAAIHSASTAARDLRLIADPRQISERLAAIRDALPPVLAPEDDVSPSEDAS